MGYVCQGKQLLESHPFFSANEKRVAPANNYVRTRRRAENTDNPEGYEAAEELFDAGEYEDAGGKDAFDAKLLHKKWSDSDSDSSFDSELS